MRSRTSRTIGSSPRTASTRSKLIAAGVCAVPALALFGAANASAYEITDFSADVYEANGTTTVTQAGAHPYQGIINFTTSATGTDNPGADQGAFTKTIRVDTPPGLVPNPEAVPECSEHDLEAKACPANTQIGTVALRLRTYLPPTITGPFRIAGVGTKGTLRLTIPLYNMERSSGSQLARFSFNPAEGPTASGEIVDIVGGMRPDDNGLFFTINNVTRPTSAANVTTTPILTGSKLTFWGDPTDATHTPQRKTTKLELLSSDQPAYVPQSQLPPGAPADLLVPLPSPTTVGGNGAPTPSTAPSKPFLTSPTSCTGPLNARLTLDTYAAGESFPPQPAAGTGLRRTRDYTIGKDTNGATGCDKVPFSAKTTFGPSSMQNDAPVPLSVALDVPESDGPIATAHVKKVAVTLPPGMTISPSAANGLEACTDDQFGKGTDKPIACSAASRIGAVKIKSPVLANALEGSVYIGQPLSGNRYRLFVNADGYGISIRLTGTVIPDGQTGQVLAVFDDNPQLPFTQFKLDFNGGSRAIIASPQTCGTPTGNGVLSPWSGNAASTTESSVNVTDCAGNGNPFAPTFGATAGSYQSGKYAPLLVGFGRPEGNQYLSGLSAQLPKGMTAKIKGVTQCSEVQIAAEACPESARVATVTVKAGPGAEPYTLSGPAYLTGGYKGGAFGTVAIIHVVAGPYDLGNVVVRQALRIDPNTAQVTVDSDPLPQIKEGIVLRMRELQLNVDRKDFMRNPTSCGTGEIRSSLTGIDGGLVDRTTGLDFTDCKSLKFRPKIGLAFENASQMKKGKHPRVTATVTQVESEAGIKSTQVALPLDVALQASNAKALCNRADALADKCSKDTIVGKVEAETTILNRKLTGPVYFVKGERTTAAGKVVSTLPALYMPLSGEARVNLWAQTSVSQKRLVTTLPAVPDQPITKFKLSINGGKRGIIVANRDLCTKKAKISARFVGHNGAKGPNRKPTITTACKTSKKK